MNISKLTVVGGGQMGRALVCGAVAAGSIAAKSVHVVDPNADCRDWWNTNHPDVITSDGVAEAVADADAVILAVKPHIVESVTTDAKADWTGKLVISIAAGIRLPKLSGWIGHNRVVRVMPNTPCLVGEGACAFCRGSDVTESDSESVAAILGSVGITVEVNDAQMDAVTGLSGSGPAYVFLMIEALADGGVLKGLPRSLAMQLAAQTVLGAAKMVRETGHHPGELKDAVASPGGTTIAALRTLEQNGVRGALIEAVKAAADRSADLG